MKKRILCGLTLLLLASPVHADQITLHETIADLGGPFGNDFNLTMFENWINQGLMNTEIYGLAADIQTSLGIAAGVEHFGTFTGAVITDNQTLKTVLQELETAVEGIEVGGLADLDDLPGDTVDDNLIDFALLEGVQESLPTCTIDTEMLEWDTTTSAWVCVALPSIEVQKTAPLTVGDNNVVGSTLALIGDTDGDGKANVLDMGAGMVKTDADGVVSAITPGTGVETFIVTPSTTNFFSMLTGEGAFAATLFGYADAGEVRTGLSLVPGTNVQVYDVDLDDLADGSLTASKVGDGLYVADDCTSVSTPATGAICFEY